MCYGMIHKQVRPEQGQVEETLTQSTAPAEPAAAEATAIAAAHQGAFARFLAQIQRRRAMRKQLESV